MINYMKKRLAFEDAKDEFESVKQQLEKQKAQIHYDRKTGRRSLMQCIRTTLVKYPGRVTRSFGLFS